MYFFKIHLCKIEDTSPFDFKKDYFSEELPKGILKTMPIIIIAISPIILTIVEIDSLSTKILIINEPATINSIKKYKIFFINTLLFFKK